MQPYIIDALVLVVVMAPPPTSLDDLSRFPDHAQAEYACKFATKYRCHLRDRIEGRLRPFDDHEDALAFSEAYQLWWIWDCLRVATDPQHCTESRLYWLSDLREKIGEEAYCAGMMPPCVPLWRFRWSR